MTFSEDDLAYLRSELGEIDPAELEQRFRRHASVTDVVVEVLRERRSALIGDPLMVTVQGVATVNNSENVKAIERRVTELTDVAAKGGEFLRPATMQVRRSR